MARSSTSFGGPRANRPAATPGNALALRHGGSHLPSLEERIPAIKERVEAELAMRPVPTPADASLVRTYCFVTAQVDARIEWFEANGGMFNSRGGPKAGVGTFNQLVDRQEKLAKLLGIGAGPAAQIAQQMAGAGKDATIWKAAQERLRARHLQN